MPTLNGWNVLIFLLFYNALNLNNQTILCLPSIYQFERILGFWDHPNSHIDTFSIDHFFLCKLLNKRMASGEKCFKTQVKVQMNKQTCPELITDNSILIILVINFEVNIFKISSNFVLDMSSPWFWWYLVT